MFKITRLVDPRYFPAVKVGQDIADVIRTSVTPASAIVRRDANLLLEPRWLAVDILFKSGDDAYVWMNEALVDDRLWGLPPVE
jgi:hypothetical protein